MKKSKLFALAGVTLLSAGVLAACGSNESDSKTFTYVYATDPSTLDYLVSGYSDTHDVTSNLVDGLLENDQYGNFVPSLAEDWTVSEDGLTYTYTLRDGIKWYTSDGEEYADVTAEDFVTGLKHAADKKSAALYLVKDSIVGLSDYAEGNTTDFTTVGVKALDDKTVQYTLNSPEPYWNSKLTSGVMFPVNAEFLESKGDDFGTPTDPSSILYNGAFYLSGITSKSSIEYTKNEDYWDADNVHVDAVKLSFYDGSDVESLANGFDDGEYDMARLFPTSANYESIAKEYSDNIIYSQQDATTALFTVNVNRSNYTTTSKTTEAQKSSTRAALQNKDFRQALSFAFDRESYTAQVQGKDGASRVLRTELVPPTFVTIGEENFGDVVEKDLASYGDEWTDVQLDDGQDGLYNVEKAQAEFAKAKEVLLEQGVEFPIHLDMPVLQASEINVQRASSFKQSVEAALGSENVVIDLQQMDEDAMYNATFYVETASQNDYDLNSTGGWTPDYVDPSTYLDIFNPEKGANVHYLGIDKEGTEDVIKAVGLDEYQALLADASAETSDLQARYEKYAAAQAWLTDSALVIPSYSGGGTPSLRRTVSFTNAYAVSGSKGGLTLYKYLEVQSDPVTTSEYEKAYKTWLEEKAESNATAQEELADHVAK